MPRSPGNDNTTPTRADRLIASTLSSATVIEEHLRVGLPAMLRANDVPAVIRDAVADFVRPVLDRLTEMEAETVKFAQSDKATVPHLEHIPRRVRQTRQDPRADGLGE